MLLSTASTSAAAVRTLRSCVCQASRRYKSAAASSSNKSDKAAEDSNKTNEVKQGFFARISKAASKAVDLRPPEIRVEKQMRQLDIEQGKGSLFDRALADARDERVSTVQEEGIQRAKVWTEHKTSTSVIQTSPRKLNEVARLIQKLPIDYAILQAQMSDKRVAKSTVKSMLALARDHAIAKGLEREKLIVQRAWVTKGIYLKRLDIKGRGRFGIRMRPEARLHVVLTHGPSRAEMMQQKFDKLVKQRLRTGAGYVREHRPIINLGNLRGNGAGYAW